MTIPFDAIRAIHNAFRKDITIIDKAADAAAHGQGNLEEVSKRYNFFNQVLVWHAFGEEKFVFPAMEIVVPLISEPYERDHRGLDALYDRLKGALGSGDSIEIARATSAFKFHLDIHLSKEEAHLYKNYNQKISLPEQINIGGNMARQIPQERFPETVAWLFPLIEINDRENVTRIWRQTLPAPAFAGVVNLIRTAVGPSWDELVDRIPELK